MSRISGRMIEDQNGHVVLLAPDHGHALITVKSSRTGKLVQKIATGREFSGNAPAKPDLTKTHAVVTRAEAAKIFNVEIEAAAKLLDVHDVGKILAYDRLHVEAIAKALRDHKSTAERTITVDPELSG